MLRVVKAKNEDVIAVILSHDRIASYYRFYGARHSILQTGYLIDFEIQTDYKGFLPRLRHLSHIPFPWLFDRTRFALWHRFIEGFEPHLKDTEEIEPFYFELLLDAAKRWHKQNPKRIAIESYVKLLEFEGRLYPLKGCYICEKPLGNDVALMSAFKPAHPSCIYAPAHDIKAIEILFRDKKSLLLDDAQVDALFKPMTQAL